MLREYDASSLIGLNVVIRDAVHETVDEDGKTYIEIPDIGAASAAAAMARCLMPIRLLSKEVRTIRHIVGMTAAELSQEMEVDPATVSRWETAKQGMGGFAEKLFRMLACDRLKDRAPGVDYADGRIINLKVLDPWLADPEFKIPTIVMERVRVRYDHNPVTSAWAATELPKAA